MGAELDPQQEADFVSVVDDEDPAHRGAVVIASGASSRWRRGIGESSASLARIDDEGAAVAAARRRTPSSGVDGRRDPAPHLGDTPPEADLSGTGPAPPDLDVPGAPLPEDAARAGGHP